MDFPTVGTSPFDIGIAGLCPPVKDSFELPGQFDYCM
jgi:hypothetical protein